MKRGRSLLISVGILAGAIVISVVMVSLTR